MSVKGKKVEVGLDELEAMVEGLRMLADTADDTWSQ